MLKRIVLLAFAFAIAGCAGCAGPPINPAASADHPANPNAPEAPVLPPSSTLAVNPSSTPTPATQEVMPGMRHGGQDMGHGQGGTHAH